MRTKQSQLVHIHDALLIDLCVNIQLAVPVYFNRYLLATARSGTGLREATCCPRFLNSLGTTE